LKVLRGHAGPVTAVVVDLGHVSIQHHPTEIHIHPGQTLQGKERWIYSASWDKTVRKWNPASQECVGVFQGHNDLVKSLLLLNESTLVSGAGDGTIRVWNTETGKCTRVINSQARSVEALAPVVALNGKLLVWAGSSDGYLRLWDLETGLQVASIRGHETNVTGIKTLLNGWYQHAPSTIVYPLADEDADERKDVEQESTWMVAASLDKSSRRFVHDGTAWKGEWTLNHDDFARTVALVPSPNHVDAHLIATGGRQEDVHIWTADGELLVKIPGHYDEISRVSVMSAKHIPARALRPMDTLVDPTACGELEGKAAALATNQSVLVSASLDGTIRFWPLDAANLAAYRQAMTSFATLQPQKDDAFLKKLESCMTEEEQRELDELME